MDWDFPANVLDVVLMGLYRGWARCGALAVQKAKARAALAEVGMADFEQRQIGQLSGGRSSAFS